MKTFIHINGVAGTKLKSELANDAYDLALEGYTWSPFSLNLEDDSDGDGNPDDVLTL